MRLVNGGRRPAGVGHLAFCRPCAAALRHPPPRSSSNERRCTLNRPTPDELRAAAGRTLRDVLAPGLRVVFCGINPSLYSAAVGHHFARPGNRFWPALHLSGFTERLLAPADDRNLPLSGLGVTNLVPRATAGAAELAAAEYVQGALRLERMLRRYRPRRLAILGVEAYRKGFGRPRAGLGLQPLGLGGVEVWVLPNPSGLNAHYQLPELAALFRELEIAARR